MIEKIFLIALIVFALLSVFTIKLRRAVIYMGVFSLIMSFVYLLYSATDVAIAEAAIGCSMSTILYLIALKKKRVCSICFVVDHNENFCDYHIKEGQAKILRSLEKFLVTHDLEPQIVYSHIALESLLENQEYNLVIHNSEKDIMVVYGDSKEDLYNKVAEFLVIHKKYKSIIKLICYSEVMKNVK